MIKRAGRFIPAKNPAQILGWWRRIRDHSISGASIKEVIMSKLFKKGQPVKVAEQSEPRTFLVSGYVPGTRLVKLKAVIQFTLDKNGLPKAKTGKHITTAHEDMISTDQETVAWLKG
jgi:hypothetical protein